MKLFFCSCFLILILISLASAGIEIIPVKEIYNLGETVQARVFVKDIRLLHELSVSDFVLLDKSTGEIIISQNLIKLNDGEYYTYFDLPVKKNSSFSFGIRNIQYFNNLNELKKDSFYADLFTSTENFGVSVRPAYLSLLNVESYDQPNLDFFVKNKGEPTNVSVSSSDAFLVPTISKFSLSSNEQKQIQVKTKVVGKMQDVFEGFVIIDYSAFSYNIPVHITRKGFIRVNASTNESIKNESEIGEKDGNIVGAVEYGSIVLASPTLDLINYTGKDSLKEGELVRGELVFLNTGNFSLENIDVVYDELEEILAVDRRKIDLVPSGSQFSINVLINTSAVRIERYRGEIIIIASNGANYSLPVHVDVLKEKKNDTIAKKAEDNVIYNYSKFAVAGEGGGFGIWVLLLAFVLIIAGVIYYLYKKSKPKQQAYENLVESFRQRH